MFAFIKCKDFYFTRHKIEWFHIFIYLSKENEYYSLKSIISRSRYRLLTIQNFYLFTPFDFIRNLFVFKKQCCLGVCTFQPRG